MEDNKNIAILVTGGTFDKEYNELDGSLYFNKPHIQDVLIKGRCLLPTRIQQVMMIDSLEMTKEDRQHILDACKSCEESKIVITHGTDTMEHTAKFLADNLQNKTIILTGAMIPYTFGSSDGLFNLGCALSFAQVLPSGVFIAMNGLFFEASNVSKDKQQGIFKSKASS